MWIRKLVFACVSIFFASIALTTFFLILRVSQAQAFGAIRYVSPNGDCGGYQPCYPTIQSAVDSAINGDLIKVAQGTYTSTAPLIVFINKSIDLMGGYSITNWNQPHPITQTTIIDAENANRRGLYIDGTTVPTITLSNMTIQRASQGTDGAGIYVVSGTIQFKNVNVVSNTVGTTTDKKGGGIYMPQGTLLVEDSLFKGNTSSAGGGIYFSGDSVIIKNSQFEDNFARYDGGAVFVLSNFLEISRSLFIDNISQGGYYGGGGVMVNSRTINVSGNEFQRNIGVSGGGLSAYGDKITVSNNLFQQNSGNANGGGAKINANTITINANTFISNTTFGAPGGGGLYLRGRPTGPPQDPINNIYYPVHLENNSFINNTARDGGGLYTDMGTITLTRNSFLRNTAFASGGALFINKFENWYTTFITSTANNFISNSLSIQPGAVGGGSIFLGAGQLHSQNDVIAQTISATQAILVSDGSFVAYHSTFVDNGSFALTSNVGTASLTDSIIMSNTVGGLAGAKIYSYHNLFYNSGTPCISGAVCNSNITGNPQFINQHTNDYHIASNSEAIDRGINSYVTSDFDGNPRPLGCGFDIGAFEYQAKNCLISPTGGQLQGLYYALIFPSGTFTDTVVITHTGLVSSTLPTLPNSLFSMDNQFELMASFINTGEPAEPNGIITLTAQYNEFNLAGTSENDLALFFWDSDNWIKEPGGVVNTIDNTITVFPNHFSIWAILGKSKAYIYLPLLIR